MKQVGTGDEIGDWVDKNGVWWGHWVCHWRDIGVWDYPSGDPCDCYDHYSAEECYLPRDVNAFNDRAEVFGCPISEMTVGRRYEEPDSGGAVAWYGHGGVAAFIWQSCYRRLIEAIWPGPDCDHWQIRLGAITWYYVMDYRFKSMQPGSNEKPWNEWGYQWTGQLANQQMWIGDSALDIRTKYPLYLHIDPVPTDYHHPEDLAYEQDIYVTMGENAVYNENEYDGAPYAIVTFSQGYRKNDGKNWQWNRSWVGMTDENGLVKMPGLYDVQSGHIRIVATRHNCRPALFKIPITPSE